MKRTAFAVFACVAALSGGTALAQSIKMKDGNFEVTTPDGRKVTVGQDGEVIDGEMPGQTKSGSKDSGSKTLELGGSDAKEPRTNAGPQKCDGTGDVLVEHKIIHGYDVAVNMTGSCDADVFNTSIDAKKDGIRIAGSGDVRVTDSEVRGKSGALVVSGSGDAIVENSELVGPVAIEISGTGNVVLRSSKVYGEVRVTGNAELVDEGGNELVSDYEKAPKLSTKPSKLKRLPKSTDSSMPRPSKSSKSEETHPKPKAWNK